MIDENLDVLFFGVLQLPVGRLEVPAGLAGHDLDVLCAKAQRRSAAIHRRIADPDDQHALADLLDMFEGDRLQPVDADVYTVAVVASGDLEILAPRRARADEDGIELAAVEQLLHAFDAMIQLQVDAHVGDVADLFVENFGREPETRDVGPHQPARGIERLEDRDVVTEGPEVVGNGQRRTAAADQRYLFAVALRCAFGQLVRDVLAVIGRYAFQPADRNRLLVDAPATAGRLARTVADAAEYAREHVRLAVFDVSVAEPALRDEPYI